MDTKDIAKRYGLEEAEVVKKINEHRAAIKEVFSSIYTDPTKLEEEIEKQIIGDIPKLFRPEGLEYAKIQYEKGNTTKFDVIVIGVSPRPRDRNQFEKYQQTQKYWECAVKEVDESGKIIGYKRDDKGKIIFDTDKLTSMINSKQFKIVNEISKAGKPYEKVVALYGDQTITRKTKNADGIEVEETIENEKYGQEIPQFDVFDVAMVVSAVNDKEVDPYYINGVMPYDTKLKHVPRIGMKSCVYGKKNSANISLIKDAYEDFGEYDKTFDIVDTVMQDVQYKKTGPDKKKIDVDIFIELQDIPDLDIRSPWVAKGIIQRVEVNKDGQFGVWIADDIGANQVKLSSKHKSIVEMASKFNSGNEVIVFGKKMQFDAEKVGLDNKPYKETIVYHELWGIYKHFDEFEEARIKALKLKGFI